MWFGALRQARPSPASEILLHVLQFDSTFGEALLAVPPAVALCFWAVMRILLMPLGQFQLRVESSCVGHSSYIDSNPQDNSTTI
jgi:hypothetical protein